MSNTTVIPLRQPDAIDDPLTEVLRAGARELLAKAVEAEVEEFLAAHAGLRTTNGHQRIVRHGHGPERQVQTGIGPVAVRRVKVRDRGGDEIAGERIRFSSAILPKWARRSASLDALLPVLYLRGISTGDFQEALSALLGKNAPNLSPPVIARLKADWKADLARWQSRDLSARHYVYIWADGIHIQARMEENAQCILVIIGASYAAIWVTGCSGSVSCWLSYFNTVSEFDAVDDLGQVVSAFQAAPCLAGRHHQFENHHERSGVAEAAFGAHGSVPHGREYTFDRVGRAQVLPVLGRKIEEGEHNITIFRQAGDRGLIFRLILLGKDAKGRLRAGPVRRAPNLDEVGLCVLLKGLRQLVEHVGNLVYPAPLMTRAWEHFVKRFPKPQCAVTGCKFWRDRKSARLQIDQ